MSLTIVEMGLRVLAAMAAGMLVGLERESHGRAAGMRTNMLVCAAACLAMLISESIFSVVAADPATVSRPDPVRMAQGVLSGMGFLGAGAILRQGNKVQGLTTAATLWYVSMLGLAFGAGLYVIGGFGLLVAWLVLLLFPRIEGLVKEDWYANVTVNAAMDGLPDDEIKRAIEAEGVKVKRASLQYDVAQRTRTVVYEIKFKRDGLVDLSERVVWQLINKPGVHRVEWQ